jgi:DNA-binding NarL/FixJ family response regulator
MESPPIRIIIVDDSDIYRAGLRDLINRHGGLRVVAEADCGEKAIEAVKSFPADLVLLDLSLPRYTGFEVLRKIREISDIKVLVLTIYESSKMILDAKALGAQGYCVKDVSRKELVQAIMEVAAGNDYVCRKDEMEMSYGEVGRLPPSKD